MDALITDPPVQGAIERPALPVVNTKSWTDSNVLPSTVSAVETPATRTRTVQLTVSGAQAESPPQKYKTIPSLAGSVEKVEYGTDGDLEIGEHENSSSNSDQLPGEGTLQEATIRFNNNLRLFKYLLHCAGLHNKTGPIYRNFLRFIIGSCAVLCITNLFLKTTSYRNLLFDITLSLLHVWVCLAYETWRRFLQSRTWKELMLVVARHKHERFSKRINIVGWIAAVAAPGAGIMISLGWLVPLMTSAVHREEGMSHNDWGFVVAHAGLMLIIVFPWACVCLCSVFLFHLVTLAMRTDMDAYYTQTVRLMKPGAEQPMMVLANYRLLRDRLVAAAQKFQFLFTYFVILAFLLVLAGCVNINLFLLGRSVLTYNKLVQDLFFACLGVVAIWCALWTTATVTSYWRAFCLRIHELPGRVAQLRMVHHNTITRFFDHAPTGYIVFGQLLDPAIAAQTMKWMVECIVVVLIFLNLFNRV